MTFLRAGLIVHFRSHCRIQEFCDTLYYHVHLNIIFSSIPNEPTLQGGAPTNSDNNNTVHMGLFEFQEMPPKLYFKIKRTNINEIKK